MNKKYSQAARQIVLLFWNEHVTQVVDIYNQYPQLFDAKKYIVAVDYLNSEFKQPTKHRTLFEQVGL